MHWRSNRIALVLGAFGVSVAAILVYVLGAGQQDGRGEQAARFMSELMGGTTPIGAPFTLEDQYGRRTSLSDLRGSVVLLYFGYAYCPDVCPTDLLAIAEVIRALGVAGDAVQPVFVTVDPERDTAEMLRSYAAAFHPRLIALRGTERDVRRVASDYKVFYEKVRPPGSSSYVIDHMAFIFVLDREGRYVAFFPPGTSAHRMMPALLDLLQR